MEGLNENRDVPAGDGNARNPRLSEALSRVKSLELELEESRAELAARDLRLQELSSFKEQLTQMLIHDLRSPLTGITGNLDLVKMLMRRNGDREKTDLLINRAQESTRRLEALVTDILDIGRSQENRMELTLSEVDIRPLLIDCCGGFVSLAELEEKRLLVEVGDGVPVVRADREILRRVIANLLQNALKFTPVGGEIRLNASAVGSGVLIEVSDSGEGIPENQREWIFERFRRAPRPGEPTRSGFGLGLAFCRLAVEAHGGRIRVEPVAGGGSRFVVELPLAAGRGDDDPVPSRRETIEPERVMA